MLKKYITTILVFFIHLNLFGIRSHKFMLISIPKCGTHLIEECLFRISGQKAHFIGHGTTVQSLLNNVRNVKPNYFLKGHLPFSNQSEKIFFDYNIPCFYIYRDPGDQVVSFVYYIFKCSDIWLDAKNYTFDKLMLNLIEESSMYIFWSSIKNIFDFYEAFMPWERCSNVCTIRFEDLIGPNGGGNQEAQFDSLIRIANHIGIVLTESQLARITTNLFGFGGMFREGKIGSWREHFKEQHKKAFKKVAGQLLIDLGYENDFNW